MGWTTANGDVLERFAAKFPPPGGPGQDDACRVWTRKLAEQFAFSFPTEGWGHKSAGGSRPPSTDVIATRAPFLGYDVIGNQGKADWSLITSPGATDLTGQTFIEVTPTDHLGGAVVTPPKPPVPALKTRDQFNREFRQVNDFYAAPEGLQRPGGMVLNGAADVVAMIQWGYDLMAGASVESVIAAIKTSDEYKQKHGA